MASGSTVDPLSFNLPSDVSPWPSSILLAEEAYVAGSRNRNDTTATASLRGDTVEVTFWIADPPAPSFYTVHYIKVPNSDCDPDSEEVVLPKVAKVAGAVGRFVLLRVLFDAFFGGYEYFIYKGHPKSPSLERVPQPHPKDHRLIKSELAFVPRGDDGHYLLIDLCDDRDKAGDYRLHIYSSQDATWRTKELPNPCPGVPNIALAAEKVFVIRDGLLLRVNLLRGMLLCDVLKEPHHARYIPLPEPLLANREQVKEIGRNVRCIRDVTCVDGMIKFIEMERREIEITDDVPPEKPIDPTTKDVLYDSDLIRLTKRKRVKLKFRIEPLQNGWRAMTWTRKIRSNRWLKGRIVDSDDILVDDSVFLELLSSQRSESKSDAWSLTFKNLRSTWPTLSADGNDILYLKSHAGYDGGAMVAVDLAEKTLKVEAPGRAHPFGKHFFFHSPGIWRPCALANHLKMTPGIKVSACQIARTGSSAKKEESFTNQLIEKASYPAATVSSANEPNKTAVKIRVGEPDSYESDNKRARHASYSVH